ncbi:hypothetical protein [Roseococcus pinisoli]|uniref:Uncharacterized protein n=1 Tax=Roseococcus pinisoli TaxID=2835040 RepID=A0ABS5QFA8_9PROT|nr:hypothetical protein [Roseococcus pinisoli]MBS7812361.1 hypothetical protein [Roseococcus pinisoli]
MTYFTRRTSLLLKDDDQPRDGIGRFAAKASGLVGGVISHFTTKERAASIEAGTHDLSRSSARSWQGAGLYFFPGEGPEKADFGEVKLTAEHAIKAPFVGTTTEVEAKVSKLKAKLVPPIFNLPGGLTVPGLDGQPLRLWNEEQTENAALREAWMAEGYDSLVETDAASGKALVVAIFNQTALGKVFRKSGGTS